METILPPAVSATAIQAGGPTLTPLAVVSVSGGQIPLVPGQIIQGQILQGQIIQGNMGGQPTGAVSIGTAQSGTLVVQAKGASADLVGQAQTVTVQVVAGPDGGLSLRLLAVDGQAVGRGGSGAQSLAGLANPLLIDLGGGGVEATPAAPVPPSSDPAASVASAGSAPVRSDAPQGFIATVIRAADEGGAAVPSGLVAARAAGGDTPLAVGTTLTLRIRDVIAVPTTDLPASVPLQGAGGTAQAAAQPEQTTEPGPSVQPSAQPVVRAASSPGSAESPAFDLLTAADGDAIPPSTQQASALEGRVITLVAGHRAVVETPVGTLSMPASPALKPQSLVLFDMVGQPRPPDPVAEAAGGWGQPGRQMAQMLGEALSVLTENGATTAAQKLLAVIPQLDSRLAASMSVFIKAVDKGSSRELIDAEDSLSESLDKVGRKSVADRLTQALDGIEKEAEEPVADGQWRAFTMPLWNPMQGEVDPIRLYVRQPVSDPHDPDSGQGGKAPGQEHRFVVDLTLSRLGRLQMDGLVLRTDKRFDLILRMERPFPAEMRHDIVQLFTRTVEAIGVKGGVTFQGGGRFLSFPPGQTGAKSTAITI